MSFRVRIDHLSDTELQLLGYSLVVEADEFKLYRCYDGSDHIVASKPPRHMYVEDINDATAMMEPGTSILVFK